MACLMCNNYYLYICLLRMCLSSWGHLSQVGEPHLRVGQACHLLKSSSSFNEHYRTLAPGGAVMLVAWSFGPSPFKKQHVVVSLSTSAADVNVSDLRAKVCVIGGREGGREGGDSNSLLLFFQ